MAVNLKREKHHDEKHIEFTDEDFSSVSLDCIRENKRIFIPCDELPDDEEERFSYLNSLTSFIYRKTEIYCSYVYVHETEPYEVKGFFVQIVPEFKDCHGIYIKYGETVYDRADNEWCVSYSYKDNVPLIILDSESGKYIVVENLSEFSSKSGHLIPPKPDENASEYISGDLIKKKKGKDDDRSFHIGTVIIGVLLGLGLIILFGFGFELLSDFLNEAIPEEVIETMKDNVKDFNLIDLLKISVLTGTALSLICISIRIFRRLTGRY